MLFIIATALLAGLRSPLEVARKAVGAGDSNGDGMLDVDEFQKQALVDTAFGEVRLSLSALASGWLSRDLVHTLHF